MVLWVLVGDGWHLEQFVVARLGLELAAVLDGLFERGGLLGGHLGLLS